MATFGKVTVTYNGARIDQYLVDDMTALMEQLSQTPVQTIEVNPDWFKCQPFEWSGSLTFTLVRVRPAAPIRACLWRRNLDGGAWRKRGHVAHRG